MTFGTAPADASRLIARIRKNGREEVRVSVDRWRGLDLVNLRLWYRAPDGEMRPGRQGIALRLDLLDELRAALDMADLALPAADGTGGAE